MRRDGDTSWNDEKFGSRDALKRRDFSEFRAQNVTGETLRP